MREKGPLFGMETRLINLFVKIQPSEKELPPVTKKTEMDKNRNFVRRVNVFLLFLLTYGRFIGNCEQRYFQQRDPAI